MHRFIVWGALFSIAATIIVPLPLSVAQAAAPKQKDPGVVELPNPFATKTAPNPTIQQIIGSGIKTALGIMGSIALVMFFYGGYLWLISGGSTDRIKKGKETIIWATIGLTVILGSGILARSVIDILQGR